MMPLIGLVARGGDLLGAGPVTTTALAQMEYGNVADPVGFSAAIGFRPRAMERAFQAAPSHVQDRWHARLYFIPPLLTGILALLWIGSGAAGLTNPPTDALIVTMAIGAPPEPVPWILGLFCLIDIGIGLWLATGRAGRLSSRHGDVVPARLAGFPRAACRLLADGRQTGTLVDWPQQ